jgi:hypothetical protein
VPEGMAIAAAPAAATCKHIPEQELPQSCQKAWQQLPLLLLPLSTHISTRVASDVSKGMETAAPVAASCKHIPEQELPLLYQKAWQ